MIYSQMAKHIVFCCLMDIFAQCLRKETLIERFKIRDLVRENYEITHRTSFAEKNERNEGEI